MPFLLAFESHFFNFSFLGNVTYKYTSWKIDKFLYPLGVYYLQWNVKIFQSISELNQQSMTLLRIKVRISFQSKPWHSFANHFNLTMPCLLFDSAVAIALTEFTLFFINGWICSWCLR